MVRTMAGAQILSVPFRVTPAGPIATVLQGSDQANAEQIGVILQTVQGERDMQPGFGIPDPAFSGVSGGVVAAQVALWGPSVTIDSVTSTVGSNPNTTDLTVDFT